MTAFKPWEYRAEAGFVKGTDLTGYTVVAVDGDLGHVEAEYDGRPAYLDVDVGSWLFGHHVTLPVGLVERIDATERKVYVDRTKDQIADAPTIEILETIVRKTRRHVSWGQEVLDRLCDTDARRERRRARAAELRAALIAGGGVTGDVAPGTA